MKKETSSEMRVQKFNENFLDPTQSKFTNCTTSYFAAPSKTESSPTNIQ